MRFEILDVGHGFCAYLLADNGNVMLFDCGNKSDPEFHPTDYLQQVGITAIELFFITNYDEDHISDFPRLQQRLPINCFYRNKTIDVNILRALKEKYGPISNAMQSLSEMIENSTPSKTPDPDYPGVTWSMFYNRYGEDFTDTNNLSLVIFLNINDSHVIIPGDIEKQGWEKLLKNEAFREKLAKVNIFIASHHGREDGYCEEVFKYCHPTFIVICDGPKRFATQEMVNTYATHASGIEFNNEPRKVLTTRNDGTLTWKW